MPGLGPGVGVKNVHPGNGGRGQPFKQVAGVVIVDADILQPPLVNAGQELGNPVDEGLRADEAGLGAGRRPRHKMLAAAKADFQTDIRRGFALACARHRRK